MGESESTTNRVVLVALQGGDSDPYVLSLACGLARTRGAQLRALFVVEIPQSLPLSSYDEEGERRGRNALDVARQMAAGAGCQLEGRVLPARDAGQAIVEDAAEVAADVVVIAKPFRARRGDAAMTVLDKAVCSVVLWRGGK